MMGTPVLYWSQNAPSCTLLVPKYHLLYFTGPKLKTNIYPIKSIFCFKMKEASETYVGGSKGGAVFREVAYSHVVRHQVTGVPYVSLIQTNNS